jgi:hypothetical protein
VQLALGAVAVKGTLASGGASRPPPARVRATPEPSAIMALVKEVTRWVERSRPVGLGLAAAYAAFALTLRGPRRASWDRMTGAGRRRSAHGALIVSHAAWDVWTFLVPRRAAGRPAPWRRRQNPAADPVVPALERRCRQERDHGIRWNHTIEAAAPSRSSSAAPPMNSDVSSRFSST